MAIPGSVNFSEQDRHRLDALEGRAGDDNDALSEAEVDELLALRNRWRQYLAHRAAVLARRSDPKPEIDDGRETGPADPLDDLGAALACYRAASRRRVVRPSGSPQERSALRGHERIARALAG